VEGLGLPGRRLTPRYLVAARPPAVPAHAGTLDVDIVIDLQILADTEAYHTLEDNLKKMGFERAENEAGKNSPGVGKPAPNTVHLMVLELLADAPDIAGGKVQPLPTEGRISALNIPHSSIVFDLHQVTEIQAELLGGNGVATEKVKHANLVSFTCLKSFAFDQRFERKDAHDLIYCIEHAPEGSDCRRRRLPQRAGWQARRSDPDLSGNPAQPIRPGRKDRGVSQGWPGVGRQVRTWRERRARAARGEGVAPAPGQRRDRTTLSANRIGGGVANGLDDDRLRKSVGAETAARLRPKTKGTV
jgi:hypothetical protein